MKQDIEKLRKKYIDNPPEGMTSGDIRHMSGDELLDMDYFLNEDDLFDESYPEDLEFEVDDTPETKAEIIKAVPASAIKRLKELNLGIKYIYVQNGSGQSDDITIPASEL